MGCVALRLRAIHTHTTPHPQPLSPKGRGERVRPSAECLLMAESPRLARSVVANWVGFAAQVAAAFLVSPVLVHGLGDRRYGLWSLVESVLGYLMLFDLGVAASVVR